MTTSRSKPTLMGYVRDVLFAGGLYLQVAGKPVPCPRPRVTRSGATFYSATYSGWRTDALRQLTEQSRLADTFTVPLNVAVEVVGERPNKTVLPSPRGDVDNFAKSILDALTKARVWEDDSLVETLVVTKRWAAAGEEPGFNVWINPA